MSSASKTNQPPTNDDHKPPDALSSAPVLPRSTQIAVSAICFLSFLLYGASCASLGAALPILADRFEVSSATAGLLFMARGAGYTLGALLSAVILRFCETHTHVFSLSKETLNCASLTLTAFSFVILRSTHSFDVACLSLVLQGVGYGGMDVFANCLFPQLWGKEVQPWMQALHTCFGLGAIVGPTLIGGAGVSVSFDLFAFTSFAPALLLLLFKYHSNSDKDKNTLLWWRESEAHKQLSDSECDFEIEMNFTQNDNQELNNDNNDNSNGGDNNDDVSDNDKIHLLQASESTPAPFHVRLLVSLFLFVYVGLIVSLLGWIPSFALDTHVANSPSRAAYLAAIFNLAATFGRFASIYAALLFSATALLRGELAILLTVSIASVFLLDQSYSMAAVISSLLALGLCAVYPVTMTVITDYGFKLDSVSTTMMIVGGTLGEAVLPICFGVAMHLGGTSLLPLLTVICTLLMCILYTLVHVYSATAVSRGALSVPKSDDCRAFAPDSEHGLLAQSKRDGDNRVGDRSEVNNVGLV